MWEGRRKCCLQQTCLRCISSLQHINAGNLTWWITKLQRSVSVGFNDKIDIILELSSGVGGQEAMLFTADTFEVYKQFAAYKRWKFDVVDYQTTEIGKCWV